MKDCAKRLLEIADRDGCEASIEAVKYINALEKTLDNAREYEKRLRIKVDKARRKRDELLDALGHDPETSLALRTMREHRDI